MKTLNYLFLIVATLSWAQNDSDVKWGEVSDWEVNLTEVDFEKDADAVILYESNDFDVAFPRAVSKIYKRIKILSKKGLEQANIQLTYYSNNDLENIKYIKARTINIENGNTEILEVSKDEIYTVDVNELYQEKRFTFPNVKVGSILEFKYTFETEGFYFLEGWAFQHEIPTIKSDFKVEINANLEYTVLYRGDQLIEKYAHTNKKETDGHIVLKNIPSVKNINHVYHKKDYLEKINFQLQTNGYTGEKPFKSWSTSVKNMNSALKQKRSKNYINDIAKQIPTGNSEYETLKNVIEYVDDNYSHNGFTSRFPKRSNREIYKAKSGSTAELNHLLNALLEAKNIDAKMVLISTRYNGKVLASYPYMGQFNKMINLVNLKNKSNYLVDAAEINSSNFKFMPKTNYNHYALVLNEKQEQWVKVVQPVSKLLSIQSYQISNDSINFKNRYQQDGFFIEENDAFENQLTHAIDLNYNTELEKKE